MTPTQLSLRHLRAQGYTAAVVERYDSFSKKRHDLFGVWDLLAVKPGETLAVQTTTASNVSARVRKIADSEYIGAAREAGWRLECHGWDKGPNGRWRVRVVDVS